MNHLHSVLVKTFIIPFYRSHAGLLLFVFLIMFGTVESSQLVSYHRALIDGMFSSTLFTACMYSVWFLYVLKILLFNIQLLRKPAYQFTNNLMLLPHRKAFILLGLITAAAFLPVFAYTLFIYQVGIARHYYLSSLWIFIFQAILCLGSAGILLTILRTKHIFSWTLPDLKFPTFGLRIGFYISHFFSEQKIAALLSKSFSLVILYLVKENTVPGDDFRIFALAWLLVLMAHAFLVMKVRMFEDQFLTWSKALPIPVIKTYVLYFIFYSALLIPECVLLFGEITSTIAPVQFVLLVLLSGALLTSIHAYLLKAGRDPDQFTTYLFWLFILSFLLILSNLIAILILLFCITSYLLIAKRYYQYEAGQ